MNKTYVTGLIIIVPCLIFGQINFTDHTIATGAGGFTSVHAADVDGDGDMDVLSTTPTIDDH